jgi:hypothetical protein
VWLAWDSLSNGTTFLSSSSYDENFTAKNVSSKGGNPWLSASSSSSSGNTSSTINTEHVTFGFGATVELSGLRLHSPSNGWPGAEPAKFKLQVCVFTHVPFITKR